MRNFLQKTASYTLKWFIFFHKTLKSSEKDAEMASHAMEHNLIHPKSANPPDSISSKRL